MDERRFRKAMGTFPTGVTVITTQAEDGIHGMTANAFMSVSLQPPLILIAIDEKARMLEKIKQVNRFGISILKDNQRDLSMHFAGQKKMKEAIRFDWVSGLPVIAGSLAQFACTTEKAIVAGDHTLFLGKVDEIRLNDSQNPLTFYQGNYYQLELDH